MKRRWVREDAGARRLLEEIGTPDLDYYSAGDERAAAEALKSWPLLAAVSRELDGVERPLEKLRVVDQPDPSPEEQ